VAEPVCGHRELHRHERVDLPLVEAAIHHRIGARLVQDRTEHLLADHPPQEVVDHQPLVVPADDPLHRLEVGLAAPLERLITSHQV
jgi:hypothetical protein